MKIFHSPFLVYVWLLQEQIAKYQCPMEILLVSISKNCFRTKRNTKYVVFSAIKYLPPPQKKKKLNKTKKKSKKQTNEEKNNNN